MPVVHAPRVRAARGRGGGFTTREAFRARGIARGLPRGAAERPRGLSPGTVSSSRVASSRVTPGRWRILGRSKSRVAIGSADVMEVSPSSRRTAGPPAEMDTGRPGTGQEPAFHVRQLEARRPIADGARQRPGARADPEQDHPHGNPELLGQGDRGGGWIIPCVGFRGLGRGPVGVVWTALLLPFEFRWIGLRRGALGVDACGRIDGFPTDGAEYPGSSRCRGGLRIHHGCPARAKPTSRGTSSRCSSAEMLRFRIAGRQWKNE